MSRKIIVPVLLLVVGLGAFAAGKYASGWPVGGKAQGVQPEQVQIGDADLLTMPPPGSGLWQEMERQRMKTGGGVAPPPISQEAIAAARRRFRHALLPCGDVWTTSNREGFSSEMGGRAEYYCEKRHGYYEGAGRFIAFR